MSIQTNIINLYRTLARANIPPKKVAYIASGEELAELAAECQLWVFHETDESGDPIMVIRYHGIRIVGA